MLSRIESKALLWWHSVLGIDWLLELPLLIGILRRSGYVRLLLLLLLLRLLGNLKMWIRAWLRHDHIRVLILSLLCVRVVLRRWWEGPLAALLW